MPWRYEFESFAATVGDTNLQIAEIADVDMRRPNKALRGFDPINVKAAKIAIVQELAAVLLIEEEKVAAILELGPKRIQF